MSREGVGNLNFILTGDGFDERPPLVISMYKSSSSSEESGDPT